jgi:hypothetical protein
MRQRDFSKQFFSEKVCPTKNRTRENSQNRDKSSRESAPQRTETQRDNFKTEDLLQDKIASQRAQNRELLRTKTIERK